MANPNIFAAYAQPLRSVADYEDQFAQRDLRAQKLRGVRQQNALQALTMRQQQAGMEEAQRKRNALQSVYQGLGAEVANPDRLIQALKSNPDTADAGYAAEKQYLERRKAEADIGKTGVETEREAFGTALKRLDAVRQATAGARDQRSYDVALQGLKMAGIDVSQIPARFDPAYVQAQGAQALTQQQRLEEEAKRRGYDLDVLKYGEDVRRNKATEGLTARGQNMTDARAREMQRLQADANEIQKTGQRTQLVDTPNGPMLVDKGTGQGRPVMVNGQPAPGESQMKREAGARQVLGLLADAEKIIPQATGSMVGSAADMAAGVVGIGTSGAQAIAQLKAIEGGLLSQMPRMEGPQSNIDVAMYRQAAGDLGNPSTPNSVKRAALKTIREIQTRYAGGGAMAPVGASAAPKPTVSNW